MLDSEDCLAIRVGAKWQQNLLTGTDSFSDNCGCLSIPSSDQRSVKLTHSLNIVEIQIKNSRNFFVSKSEFCNIKDDVEVTVSFLV